jgi:hypothetical protein
MLKRLGSIAPPRFTAIILSVDIGILIPRYLKNRVITSSGGRVYLIFSLYTGIFIPPPKRQRIKNAYPKNGLNPIFAKATAGARIKRTGINKRNRRNNAKEIGKNNISFVPITFLFSLLLFLEIITYVSDLDVKDFRK